MHVTRRRLRAALLSLATLPALLVATDGSATPFGGTAMQPDAALLARARSGDAAAGATLFAADLVAALGRQRQGNLVVSPLSVDDALTLLAPGARGSSLQALLGALHSTVDAPSLLLDMARLRADMSGDGATLRIAAAAWLQQDLQVQPAYRELLTEAGAPPRPADFIRDADAARRAINAWIDESTAGRIHDMLARGALDETVRLVLADAIALDGEWATPFARRLTTPQAFHAPGADRSVQTMHQTGHMAYATGNGWRAVRLPYKGGRLDAMVVLPDPGVDPLAALPAVTAPQARNAFSDTLVSLALPRFELRSSVDLQPAMGALGLGLLFDPLRVDLSGIAGNRGDLAVGRALHQAMLSVDENGTIGAAATVISVVATALHAERIDPVQLTVDRPFLFVVEDSATGVPVFVARVSDPGAAAAA
jgi:serpin B